MSGGEPDSTAPEPVSRVDGLPVPYGALCAAIARVHLRGVEHAVLLDVHGNEVWRGTGSATEVVHPVIPDTVVVHNHPNGSDRFSLADVQSCLAHNELGVVAVGHQRWTGFFRTRGRWGTHPVAVQLMRGWAEQGAPPPMETLARLVGGVLVSGGTDALRAMEA